MDIPCLLIEDEVSISNNFKIVLFFFLSLLFHFRDLVLNYIKYNIFQDRNDITGDQVDDEGNFAPNFAQIVITAATPMVEDPEKKFPPVEKENEETHKEEQCQKEPEIPKQEPPQVEKISEPTSEQKHETKIEEEMETRIEEDEVSTADDQPADCGPFPVSSSSASEGESTGPSTAENSQQQDQDIDHSTPKQVVGGRASIPDELAPHQLARLQNLKESNA